MHDRLPPLLLALWHTLSDPGTIIFGLWCGIASIDTTAVLQSSLWGGLFKPLLQDTFMVVGGLYMLAKFHKEFLRSHIAWAARKLASKVNWKAIIEKLRKQL